MPTTSRPASSLLSWVMLLLIWVLLSGLANSALSFLPESWPTLAPLSGMLLSAAALMAWGRRRRLKQKPEPQHPATPDAHHWKPTGHCDHEVVGESHYQQALRDLSSHSDYGGTECIAELRHEPDNRHDRHAVAVWISGRRVGYLSRDDAEDFRQMLKKHKMPRTTTTCNAVIVGGGTRRDGVRLHYGVKLDLDTWQDDNT